MNQIRIVFFGTPEFAASQLEAIISAGYDVAAVVTVPDKPAGRGKKLQCSEVKKKALLYGLPLLQPEKMRDPLFLEELTSYNANLFVVVAFRMLPAIVWQMPSLGTFNLHASLLPQYRGAAPINHAIINGETETGLTTFFLNEEIDKGAIILQQKVSILPNETAGELHDKLMALGNTMVVDTIRLIEKGKASAVEQENIAGDQELKPAPKIFKTFCYININDDCLSVHNLVRGLSPYPAAHVILQSESGESIDLKVFKTEMERCNHKLEIGQVDTDNKKHVRIALKDGFISLIEVQQSGKRAMPIEDFLRGTPLKGSWKALENPF